MRFEWLPTSAFSLDVSELRDRKWLTADLRRHGPVGPTEGNYLAVVFIPQEADAKEETLLLTRVRIDNVVDSRTVRAEVPQEAAQYLTRGINMGLIRPRGSTTEQMLAVPPAVLIRPTEERFLPAGDGRYESIASLRAISLAWATYADVFKRYPSAVVYGPDGKPWHSWRVLILPLLPESEYKTLYKRYNLRAGRKITSVFCVA